MADPLDVDTLLSQGACCGNGCTNCPYINEKGERHQIGEVGRNESWIRFKKDHPNSSYDDWESKEKG